MHIDKRFANTQQDRLESAAMDETLRAREAESLLPVDLRDALVRDMLLAVVNSLVDEVGLVEMVSLGSLEGMAFHVRLSASDVGKLIGKGGRTARAIRCILSGNAAKHGRRYSLDIARV